VYLIEPDYADISSDQKVSIGGPMTLSHEDWSRHFTLQAKCGLSVKDYCHKHRIPPHRWYYWHRRIAKMPSDFLPVVIRDQKRGQSLTVSLMLGNGCRLVIEGIEGTQEVSRLVSDLHRNAAA